MTLAGSLKTSLAISVFAMALAACAGAPEPALPAPSPVAAGPATPLVLSVLSNRKDLLSGGDALIEVKNASGPVSFTAGGAPLPAKQQSPGRYYVSGLKDGASTIKASANGASGEIAVTNYPITGPILSGPHLKPYDCKTKESGLGDATDANCSAPTKFEWFYKDAAGKFQPLANPKAQQGDVAKATTIDGRTVPYIVRVESGVINRTIYRIAVLDDPTTEASVVNEGWNGRLGITFGGGCGTNYNQGTNTAESVLSDLYLARGFAFMNSTELVNQAHCNQVLQGETLMMLKEHFIEGYGVPKWTVGTGGSGGSIQQMVITQMMPGLLDGLQPSLSFPDSSMQTADCGLLQNFWRTADGKKWSQDKKSAVEGYSAGTCGSWERSFVRTIQAAFADGCGLADKSLVYDPKTNPKGVRCTTQEMRANIYGRDPATGFARRPIDNVGVQYGLKAVNEGAITVDEFLTLNEKVGGNDPDGGFWAKRTVGDEQAIKAIYASGLINTFANLDRVPMLHYRTYNDTMEPGDIHDRHRDLTIRARLEKASGKSDNQVIWIADRAPGRGQPATVNLAPIALDVMTKWLDAMAADPAPLSHEKVVKHKPADAVDAYWTPDGKRVNEVASWDASTSWNKTYPVHSEPRLVAGAPITNDVMKCQLKPADAAEYKVKFTPAQALRLKKVFPEGVCDWSKPSVGYSSIKATYQKY
jgi:hypothetical protein